MRAIVMRASAVLSACVLAVAVQCTLGPTAGTGGTGSEVVIGMVTNEDGTPARNTEVRLYTSDFNPASPAVPELTGSDTTDSAGRYAITMERATGDTFTLQAYNDQYLTRCVISEIAILPAGESTLVATAVLKQTGSIKVLLADSGSAGSGYVYIPGTTFQGDVSDGMGYIDSVPEGIISRVAYRQTDTPDSTLFLAAAVTVTAGIPSIVTGEGAAYSSRLFLNTTSSGADVEADVHDFPLLVRLTEDNFPFDEARSDGSDIRITKPDNTPLSFEIERWDADNRKAEVWVKVDTVYGNDSSVYVVLYWGEPAAAITRSEIPVFGTDQGFRGVWHLAEEASGTGTAGLYTDATGVNDGDDFISATGQSGIIGPGRTFDGVDDYILVNSQVTSYKNSDMSISLWVSIGDSGGAIFSKLDSSLEWNKGTESFYFGDGTDTHEQIPGVNGARPSFVGFADSYAIAADSLSVDTWHHLAFTWKWDGDSTGTAQYYIDGEAVALSKDSLYVRLGENPEAMLRIGQPNNNESFSFFNGSMDELRLAAVERSADWIRLCYMNQRETDRLVRFK